MKKLSKSSLAVLLALVMIFSVMSPISAFAVTVDKSKLGSDTYLTSKTDYTVAPGITEAHVTTNNGAGSNQVQGYALEVDLSNPTTSIISSYKNYDATSWGMQKVRDQAYAAEKKLGVNVVAGVNGDFYNMQTGAPTGTFIMNGTVYHVNNNWNYFAILNDGTAVIGSGALDTSNVKECIGGPAVLLKDGVYTSDVLNSGYGVDQLPRTAVGIKADGSVVLYVADGRQAPKSCGQTFKQLADAMLAMGCVDALSLDGGGSATFISQHEGSDELVCRNSPSDGTERTVSSALLVCSSAKPTGVFDHATLTPNNEVYTPGSSIQFEAKGVDSSGAAVDLPEDGTFALADSSFGTIDETGLFVSSGKTGTVTVNYVSGGEVCGNVSIEVQIPDTLYVPSAEVSLGFEETTDFSIVAKYQERTVNMKAGDLTWTITDEAGNDISGQAGTFDGLTFTTFDGVTINALITATLTHDTSVTGKVKAIIGAMPVVLYDFEYTTDKAEAEANPDLEWIPSYEMPTYDRSLGTTSGYQASQFYEQGYPLYNWPNAALTDQNSMKSRIVSKADGEPVRFGEHSYRIDYSYETYNKASNANNYVRVTTPDHAFDGSPTAIGCWVYIPEGTANFALYLNCANQCDDPENGYNLAYAAVTGSNGIDWTGWKYVEFDLTNASNAGAGPANAPFGFYQGCGVFWISYQPGGPKGDKTASTIYLDNIQLVYGANTDDTTNPLINSIRTDKEEIEDGKTVLTSNVNTFRASYADAEDKYATGIDFSEVKMYLDGVDVTDKCYINEGDEEIYLYDASLANGTHNIQIVVADIFGNSATETRYFTVQGDAVGTEANLVAVDEAPVLGTDYTLAITTNQPQDVIGAEIGVKILSYFTKYWDQFTVVPSANYELVGEATYDATNTTINFTLNRKADADPAADDGTMAKIVFAIPTNVPEGLEVTYRVDKGDLTYATEKDGNFVGVFSGKITTTCTSPFIITPDTMVVGSAGGAITVTDAAGKPVEGVNIYTVANELLGVTDADGKIITDKFVSAVAEYQIYAEKDGLLSFVYKGQSYPAGGDETGAPSFVKLNASKDTETSQSISWMSSPLASADKAVVLYAEKSAYEADGDAAFKTFEGTSIVSEMASSATAETNYAVRINNATVTGLTPDTEYVYKVGDGENMSSVKTFRTSKNGAAVNFFVIGDTQATDTTNTDEITKNLAASGVQFDFGIQTGDAVDNGGNYTMWANIAKVFSGDFLGTQDLIQVLGNHEYYGDDNAHNAAAYFNLPDTAEDGSAPLCYSVQYGNVYVAVINYAGTGSYKEAAEWIINDAADSTAMWKVLTMHQPAYFTNPSGNSTEMQKIITDLVDEAGIDFVFSGHDHSYARTKPVTAGEVDEANGAVYYICGSTGEKSYEIVDNAAHHFDILVDDYNATYLTVTVTDTEFTVVTHDYLEDGTDAIIDSYTMTKEVNCTDGGHAFEYENGWLTCSVCGYAMSATKSGYTGFTTDKATGRQMYLIGGNVQTGWLALGNDNYCFDENGLMMTGKITLDGHTYTFGEDGKMTRGSLEKQSNGKYCYYINGAKQRGWHEIDGYWYYFDRTDGKFNSVTGTKTLEGLTYTFDNASRLIKGAWNKTDQGTSFYWGPDPVTGLQTIDGVQYYFDPADTYMLVNESVEIDGKVYSFNEDGVFTHYGEHVDKNGDGKCEECTVKSPFWSFFQMLISFFQKIKAFFQSFFA